MVYLKIIFIALLSLVGPSQTLSQTNNTDVPKVKTFAFLHRETTGITSYAIVGKIQKPIMFSDDSDPIAVKSLQALNWRVLLPNANGKKLFLVGQFFNDSKRTRECAGCATPEIYNEFRLIDWYIVVPFKAVREDCENCLYLRQENLRTREDLELKDFKSFEGLDKIDLRRFQRKHGARL